MALYRCLATVSRRVDEEISVHVEASSEEEAQELAEQALMFHPSEGAPSKLPLKRFLVTSRYANKPISITVSILSNPLRRA